MNWSVKLGKAKQMYVGFVTVVSFGGAMDHSCQVNYGQNVLQNVSGQNGPGYDSPLPVVEMTIYQYILKKLLDFS